MMFRRGRGDRLGQPRVPAGSRGGGQFGVVPAPEPDVTLGCGDIAVACTGHLVKRHGWGAVEVTGRGRHELVHGRSGATIDDVTVQPYRSAEMPAAVLVELDPGADNPWSRAAYYELHGEELSRVVTRVDGTRFRTFVASGITGPIVLAVELDAYLRRG